MLLHFLKVCKKKNTFCFIFSIGVEIKFPNKASFLLGSNLLVNNIIEGVSEKSCYGCRHSQVLFLEAWSLVCQIFNNYKIIFI